MSSRSINKVVLLGNLTRDPELKQTPNGTTVSSFGVATNRSWTTSDGQTKEEAQYHRIVAWQKLAELSQKLLKKGTKVYLEGRVTYRDYTTKEGFKKTAAEIIIDDFIVLGQPSNRNGGNNTTNDQKQYAEERPVYEDSNYTDVEAMMGQNDTDNSSDDFKI